MGLKTVQVTKPKTHPVIYRDAQGRTHTLTVVAAGSASGVKLRRPHGGSPGTPVDNVALATTLASTGVYKNWVE